MLQLIIRVALCIDTLVLFAIINILIGRLRSAKNTSPPNNIR